MICIRADMNNCIATGHIMRCMAIGEQIRKLGEQICFIAADTEPAELLKQHGFDCEVLHSHWDKMEEELDPLIRVLQEKKANALLVDHYSVTPHYLETLQKYTKVIYLDDLNRFPYSVDLLINYAIYADELDYSYLPKEKKLLGLSYVPLRSGFGHNGQGETQATCNRWASSADSAAFTTDQELKKQEALKKQETVSADGTIEILLLAGGADAPNMIGQVLEQFIKSQAGADAYKLHITAICGALNPHFEELQQKYHNYMPEEPSSQKLSKGKDKEQSSAIRITLIRSTDRMQDYMERADLAISAAGSTLYELCATGIPTISYTLADNQLRNARTFDNRKLIPYAGDASEKETVSKVVELAMNFFQYGEFRKKREINDFQNLQENDMQTRQSLILEQSTKLQNLVDGRGARRIAEEICRRYSLQSLHILLRPMTMEDTPLIVKWRNNPKVQRNFIFREHFTNEMHENWIRTKVETGEVVQFIICEKISPCENAEKADPNKSDENTMLEASANSNNLRPIGSVYFRDIDMKKKEAEYGIFIGEDDARGKGYGNETAELAVHYAFQELHLDRLILRVFKTNEAARKSYEHAGFTFLQDLPGVTCSDGAVCDMMLFECTKGNTKENGSILQINNT